MAAKLFMGHTEVSAERSAAQIQGLLVEAGCSHISQEYNVSREVIGLSFAIVCDSEELHYKLPVNFVPVFNKINGERKTKHDRDRCEPADRERARAIAWRQLFRWVQAQLAMIQIQMVTTEQVFLPYMDTGDGRTVFQLYAERKFRPALPAPEGKAK